MKHAAITSPTNPAIRDAVSLRKRRDRSEPRFLIEGPHLIESALASSGVSFSTVFLSSSYLARNDSSGIVERLGRKAVHEVTDPVMRRICDTESPQGIAAIVALPKGRLDSVPLGSATLLVVADEIRDPGNLGVLIRNADATGATAVILLPGTCDPLSPKTVRATAGSIFHVPVREAGIEELVPWLAARSIRLVTTSLDATASLYEADLRHPLALVFGNEAHGVRAEIQRAASLSLRIPIRGSAESLNVAAASAVVLYEIVRQRGSCRRSFRIP